MHRRRVVRILLMGAGLPGLMGHTPYRQWQVYRARHLLIGTSRADPPTYPLGKQVAAVLQAHLPESSARVTRATTVHRLGSLISTDQIRVLILSESDASDIARGRGAFDGLGPVPIRILYRFGRHLLVARADFPILHAWMLVRTLHQFGLEVPGAIAPDPAQSVVPLHPGAVAALQGGEQPASPIAAEDPTAQPDDRH